MAEFLIKAVDATNADPTKDAVGCYKRGDIVDVRPDGFAWGKEEHPATSSHRRFVLVKIPGLDDVKAKAALAVRQRSATADPVTGLYATVRRRRFQVQWANLPASVRNALVSTGVVTVTLAGVRAYVLDHATAQPVAAAVI